MNATSLSFGAAIELAKRGSRITRLGWKDSGTYVCLMRVGVAIPNGLSMRDSLCINSSNGGIQIGWAASQTDMFAEDWMVVDGN